MSTRPLPSTLPYPSHTRAPVTLPDRVFEFAQALATIAIAIFRSLKLSMEYLLSDFSGNRMSFTHRFSNNCAHDREINTRWRDSLEKLQRSCLEIPPLQIGMNQRFEGHRLLCSEERVQSKLPEHICAMGHAVYELLASLSKAEFNYTLFVPHRSHQYDKVRRMNEEKQSYFEAIESLIAMRASLKEKKREYSVTAFEKERLGRETQGLRAELEEKIARREEIPMLNESCALLESLEGKSKQTEQLLERQEATFQRLEKELEEQLSNSNKTQKTIDDSRQSLLAFDMSLPRTLEDLRALVEDESSEQLPATSREKLILLLANHDELIRTQKTLLEMTERLQKEKNLCRISIAKLREELGVLQEKIIKTQEQQSIELQHARQRNALDQSIAGLEERLQSVCAREKQLNTQLLSLQSTNSLLEANEEEIWKFAPENFALPFEDLLIYLKDELESWTIQFKCGMTDLLCEFEGSDAGLRVQEKNAACIARLIKNNRFLHPDQTRLIIEEIKSNYQQGVWEFLRPQLLAPRYAQVRAEEAVSLQENLFRHLQEDKDELFQNFEYYYEINRCRLIPGVMTCQISSSIWEQAEKVTFKYSPYLDQMNYIGFTPTQFAHRFEGLVNAWVHRCYVDEVNVLSQYTMGPLSSFEDDFIDLLDEGVQHSPYSIEFKVIQKRTTKVHKRIVCLLTDAINRTLADAGKAEVLIQDKILEICITSMLSQVGQDNNHLTEMIWALNKLKKQKILLIPEEQFELEQTIDIHDENISIKAPVGQITIIRVIPYLFNVGVTAKQTLCELMDRTSLQYENNSTNWSEMMRRRDIFMPDEIQALERSIQKRVRSPKTKDVDLLTEVTLYANHHGMTLVTICQDGCTLTNQKVGLDQIAYMKLKGHAPTKEEIEKMEEGIPLEVYYANYGRTSYQGNFALHSHIPKDLRLPMRLIS